MFENRNAEIGLENWYDSTKIRMVGISALQFGHRSGLTDCCSCPGSELLDTLIVFLKEFSEKVNFEKSQPRTTEV